MGREDWNEPPDLDSIPVSSKDVHANCFLSFCKVLNVCTGCAGAGSSIVHSVIFYFCLHSKVVSWHQIIPLFMLHTYYTIFGLLIVFQECEYEWFFERVSLLESWVGRGIFVLFCACSLLVEEGGVVVDDNEYESVFLVAIKVCEIVVAWVLFCTGSLYLVMGSLCCGHLKARQYSEIRKTKQRAMQAERLSAHRHEIDLLLQETEQKLAYSSTDDAGYNPAPGDDVDQRDKLPAWALEPKNTV